MIDASVTLWYLRWIRREVIPDPLPEMATDLHTPVPLREWLKAGVRPTQIMDLISNEDKLRILGSILPHMMKPIRVDPLIEDLANLAESSPAFANYLYGILGYVPDSPETKCEK